MCKLLADEVAGWKHSCLICFIIIRRRRRRKFIRAHSHESWIGGAGSHQVAGRSMLIVNELGCQVRLEVALETV